MAREIHAGCPGLREVYVHLATRIGEPLDRPWTGVQLVVADGVALEDIERRVREIVEAELARLPAFRSELILGQHPVC
jgi:S-adenosylmethionine synthetase